MANLLETSKEICNLAGLSPKKIHGQNFLIDEEYYQKIIDTSDLGISDKVLEVGPGLGFLTAKLANKVKKVISVEIDDDICKIFPDRMKALGVKNIELVCGDVLRLDENIRYDKIVANLPYNISARFLKLFISERKTPELMVLMLQNEVVERICAKAGKMSVLAVSVQYFAEVEKVDFVPKSAFWPEPKVDSAIVRIKKKNIDRDKAFEKRLFQLVRIGFSSRRKLLKNNLSSGYQIGYDEAEKKIEKANLDRKVRAQSLSVGDWVKLLGTF